MSSRMLLNLYKMVYDREKDPHMTHTTPITSLHISLRNESNGFDFEQTALDQERTFISA